MLHSILRGLGRLVMPLLFKPGIRYRALMSLSKNLPPDADEDILMKAMSFADHSRLDGDYLEFGVWKGRSFAKAYHIHKYLFKRKGLLKTTRFYAFDSFEGLPELKNKIDAETGEFKKGDYAFSLENFKRHLASKKINLRDVEIVPGWYEDVLNDDTKKRLPVRHAAIIWVDCDLYESTVPVLEFITDYVVDGTIIIFDDWFAFRGDPDRGEQRAFREWLAKHLEITATEWQKTNWRANSFILHKRS